MVRRILKVAVCAGSLLLSGVALADHHEGHEGHDHAMKSPGMPFKIGAQIRTEWNYSDNGLQEFDGSEPDSSSNLALVALKLKIKGHLSNKTSFNFLLDNTPYVTTTAPNTDFVELGYITHKLSDMVSLRVGRDYTNYGGFERKEQDYAAFSNSMYVLGADSFGLSTDGIGLMFNWGHAAKVNVQVFQPDTQADQPAATVEYKGKFGPVKVLAQLASYKLPGFESSMAYGVGLKYKEHGLMAHLDYGMNQEKDVRDISRIGVHVKYDMGDFVPFVKYTMFEADPEVGESDNSAIGATAGYAQVAQLDGNMNQWTVGSHWRMDGNVFRPYIAVVGTSGDFVDGSDEESPSQIDLKIGVNSEF